MKAIFAVAALLVVGADIGSSCGYDEFQCYDGKCIDGDYVCDSWVDCAYGEDDTGCEVCPETHFMCGPTSDWCVPVSWICDDWDDCGDGTDERGCENFFGTWWYKPGNAKGPQNLNEKVSKKSNGKGEKESKHDDTKKSNDKGDKEHKGLALGEKKIKADQPGKKFAPENRGWYQTSRDLSKKLKNEDQLKKLKN